MLQGSGQSQGNKLQHKDALFQCYSIVSEMKDGCGQHKLHLVFITAAMEHDNYIYQMKQTKIYNICICFQLSLPQADTDCLFKLCYISIFNLFYFILLFKCYISHTHMFISCCNKQLTNYIWIAFDYKRTACVFCLV